MTYCEKQAAAVLTRCATCQREWFMTHPQPVCQDCRTLVWVNGRPLTLSGEVHLSSVWPADVNGVQVTGP